MRPLAIDPFARTREIEREKYEKGLRNMFPRMSANDLSIPINCVGGMSAAIQIRHLILLGALFSINCPSATRQHNKHDLFSITKDRLELIRSRGRPAAASPRCSRSQVGDQVPITFIQLLLRLNLHIE